MALKAKITREYLRSSVGDENIFNFYFGDFVLYKAYHSIFRDDPKKSSSFFVTEHGTVLYRDFGTSENFDCVSFVMRAFSLNYYKAIERIAIDFGLLPGERSTDKDAIIKAIKKTKAKPKPEIQVGVVKFRQHHLDYWAKYGITKEELVANNVYPVNNIYINNWQVPREPDELSFVFLIKDAVGKEYIKIYSPFNENYKWVHNGPLDIPFGDLHAEPKSDVLIITKGLKDKIILNKYFTDVIATQNESKDALKETDITLLKAKYKTIYVWFDTDRPGIKAANYYKRKHGFIPIFIRNGKLSLWRNFKDIKQKQIKDPSDFVAKYGLPVFEQYMRNIKIYNV